MEYRKIEIEELEEVLLIFRHENLKYATGQYPEEVWISEFITKGYAYGLYEEGKLKSAVVGEPLLCDGVYLWLLAVHQEEIGKGYGQTLFNHFEVTMKELGKEWIFLTAFNKCETFYLRNGFITANLQVKEFCKGWG